MLSLFILFGTQQRHTLSPISDPKLRLHTLSLLRPRNKPKHNLNPTPTNWNTTHTFVLSNPILLLLETKCRSMPHLMQIHARMTVSGLSSDPLAYSRLVAFCALSPTGDLDYSKRMLISTNNHNAFSWNIVIRAACDGHNPAEAFLLYKQMLGVGSFRSRPDNYTYPLLFKTCARLLLFDVGRQVLVHVLRLGFKRDLFVRNSLIHFLVTCGELDAAGKVFDESPVRDLVSWNSLINGYVRCGKGKEALRIYKKMEMEGKIEPDEVTLIGVVTACAQLEESQLGREFHRYIKHKGLKMTVPLANSLLDMYVKCGDLEEAKGLFEKMEEEKTMVTWTTMVTGYAKSGHLDIARRFFDKMPEKDVVPWNAMIGAYARAHRAKEALSLFHEMQAARIEPDEVTMVSCLSACAQLGALDLGIWIHGYIQKNNLSMNVVLGTALVDMYAKCGSIRRALEAFHEIPGRNALTYTAIICGLALHGESKRALSYFTEMINSGLMADEVTYLGVLSACCHGGLVEEGRKVFSQMSSKYKEMKHYSCMVDLFGRAGLLNEAVEVIESMPMEGDGVIWGALFFACRMHRNMELGEKAAKKLLELDAGDSGIYVLLAGMYVERGMWEEAEEVRRLMRERGVDKTPGCSSIEVEGNVHEFVVRDRSHPETRRVHECLVRLSRQMEVLEDVFFLDD
ncbi:Pentatricopeptide repeat-containing protein -mitochondrial [Striga hermonthica]|uniref:Pentatricopeptide repeat-containing protein -mitochondrial n=1 Tax=Striga hermonthica TaxID=68872 RepID=A0A9N7MVJ2_STRHE|nr:Pentatricopeptide repeat-containing protein -mitochondrial [Striga hermonthica]